MELASYVLGDEGRAWTRQALASGGFLSAIVLKVVDFKAGDTEAVGFAADSLPEPGAGNRLAQGFAEPARLSRAAANQALLGIIRALAATDSSLVLVAEDDLRRAGDPLPSARTPGTVTEIGGSVYHCTEAAGIESAADLGQFLASSASGYPLNAFVLPCSVLQGVTEMTAASVRCIINSIFDYESYAIWLPRSP